MWARKREREMDEFRAKNQCIREMIEEARLHLRGPDVGKDALAAFARAAYARGCRDGRGDLIRQVRADALDDAAKSMHDEFGDPNTEVRVGTVASGLAQWAKRVREGME